MKVYSGKNRGGMEVERFRERLIRELREGGSQEGKRQKKSGRNRKHRKGKQKLCEHKIRFLLRLFYPCCTLLKARLQTIVLPEQIKKKNLSNTFSNFHSNIPFSLL